MTPREKALKRLGTLLRLAHDERSPEGERDAARARCEAIQKRWGFTNVELANGIRADLGAQQPSAARRRQEAIFRAQRAAAMGRQAMSIRLIFVGQPIRTAPNLGNHPKNVHVEFGEYSAPEE